MTAPRNYPRTDCKAQNVPGDLYVVIDSRINEEVSSPKPYHDANNEAGQRNEGTFGALSMADWVPGMNLPAP